MGPIKKPYMTKDKQNRFSRRRTLQLLGSAGIAGLAGCGGGGDGGDGGSTGDGGSSDGGSSDGGSSDGGSGDGGSSDGLPSRSEAVEEWGPRINEAAREAGIDWEQESGTALTFGMNVHPYTATVEPLLDYFTELTELINTNARADLREEIAAIQDDIDEWKTEYEVESREELESTLTDDLDSTAIRDRNRVLRQWERYEDNKRLLKHALELYDDARELYPGQHDPSDSSVSLSR